MPVIEANMDDVPTFVPPIATGIHQLEVQGVPEFTRTKADDGNKIIVEYKVVTADSPDFGRRITDHVGFKNLTKVKRIALSAGISLNPLNTDDLAGQVVTATIGNRVYKDDAGNDRETSSIKDYVIPE